MAGQSGAAKALYCDTNVIIRLLTGDPPRQADAAAEALDAARDAKLPILLPDLVIAEIAYVLTTVYDLNVAEASQRILGVMDLPAVTVSDDAQLRDTLNLWAEGKLDLVDAYLASLTRVTSATGVLSFDHDYDRIERVTRYDPAKLPALLEGS